MNPLLRPTHYSKDVHMLRGLHVKRPVFKAVNALVARLDTTGRRISLGIFLVILGGFLRDWIITSISNSVLGCEQLQQYVSISRCPRSGLRNMLQENPIISDGRNHVSWYWNNPMKFMDVHIHISFHIHIDKQLLQYPICSYNIISYPTTYSDRMDIKIR